MFRRGRRPRWRRCWARDLAGYLFVLVAAILITPPLFIPVIPAETQSQQHNYADTSGHENETTHEGVLVWIARGIGYAIDRWRDDIAAVSTLGVFAFTAALALSTRRLWLETERLAKGAETQAKDTKALVGAATTSANAATAANKLANELHAAEQRPWIIIEGMDGFADLLTIATTGFDLSFNIRLRNSGRYPAEMVVVSPKLLIECKCAGLNALKAHERRADRFNRPDVLRAADPGFCMFPNDLSPIHQTCRVDGPTAEKVGNRKFQIFCSIYVTYRHSVADQWHTSARLYKISYFSPPQFDFIVGAGPLAHNYFEAVVDHRGNSAI